MPEQPQFDVDAARQSGASDDQILSYLAARTPNFDTLGALKQSPKADVISYLSTHSSPPSPPDYGAYSQTMAVRSVPRPAVPSELQPAGTVGRLLYQTSNASREALKDVGRVGLGVLATAGNAFGNPTTAAYNMAEPIAQSVAANPDMPIRAAIGTGLGVDVSGLKRAAQERNIPMLVEKSAAPLVTALMGIGAGRKMGGGRPVGALPEGAQAAVVPEAANLPPAAVTGAERIFRAAAPVGSDPQFRSNVYASAGDLAEIGRDINLREASGGVINPDMRVRATVDAINDHLSGPQGMYETERAPQIQRNAQAQVVPKFGADAREGLGYLSRNAGTDADRSLATRIFTNQESMPLASADELARAVNRELSPLRGMTPQELAVAEGNSKRFASLQALDKELSGKIGAELASRGEPGITQYEQRYAALSSVRDTLQSRMNMTELQRNFPEPARTLVNLLRKPSIAGASQAATANVNIGRELQLGFGELAKSGITPNRPTGTGAPRVRGLLGPGATQLPSAREPIGQPSPAPPTLDYIPSTQNPRKFVGPGEIRPAGQEPSLLPGGPLFQMLVNRRGGR